MKIKELVQKYELLGVHLWVENGKLKFRTNKGILTEEHKKELIANKADIINYLSEKDNIEIKHSHNQLEPFPLTDLQLAYLVGRKSVYDYGGVGCHAYAELSMEVMDKQRLEEAWHKVIRKHSMLRTVINSNGTQQVIDNITLPPIKEYDFTGSENISEEEKIMNVRAIYSQKQYDPEKWPLFDLVLTRFNDRSVIHFSIDMLIADFISVNIILGEISDYYYGKEENDHNLKYTFKDIIEYQKTKENSISYFNKKEADKKYWNEKLSMFAGAPELPLLHRKEKEIIEFEQLNYVLQKSKVKSLYYISKKLHVTPSIIILMAYAEVIKRWSKKKEFCINLTLLNRPEICEDIGEIVGDFTKIEVLRIHENAQKNYIDKAKEIQELLWQDMDHLSYNGIEFLREVSRKTGQNIIIPIVYTSTLGIEAKKKELMKNAKLQYKISQTPQVWIDCQVLEVDENILINWDIRKDVFPQNMISDMFRAFTSLLDKLLADWKYWEDTSINILPNEQKERHEAINKTAKTFKYGNLQDGFFRNLSKNPKKEAVIIGNEKYTYRDVAGYVAGIQDLLKEEKEKSIAILLPKGVLQIASILAILSTGNSYVPINCNQPSDRVNAILTEADIEYILTDHHFSNFVPESFKVIILDKEIESKNEPTNYHVDLKSAAYTIFTSGSTGTPKGVVICHEAALNTILDINEKFSIGCSDVFWGLANYSFDLSVYDLFAAFEVGATLILPEEDNIQNPEYWINSINKYGVTIWNSVPAQMQMLYDSLRLNNTSLPSLRIALLSGDWIPVPLVKGLLEDYPQIMLVSLGGATECSIWSIYYPIKTVTNNQKSIPYGQPLANQQFYILDSALEECPDYVTGKLYIAGKGLGTEYINAPELTCKKFIFHSKLNKRLYDTGDLGRYLSDGNIEILGREDNQVKIHGHRIELGEIEGALEQSNDIQLASVIKKNTNKGDVKLIAFVQLALSVKNEYTLDNKDIAQNCKRVIDKYTRGVDKILLQKWHKMADKVVLLDIMQTLQKANVFSKEGDRFKKQDILDKLNVLPKYSHLISRWIEALVKDGFIEKSENKYEYINLTPAIKEEYLKSLIAEWGKIENDLNYGRILFDYLQRSSGLLPELLKGETDPLDLFFPKGNLQVAVSAYRDNLVNRNLNKIIETGVLSYIEESIERKNIKILEIGAGVGGTSYGVISSLQDKNVTYCFTDISTFFLNEARKAFGKYNWVQYNIFDINEEYWNQGFISSDWDIIICANVLHNSKNIHDVLKRLKELSKPGGLLMMIEATGERHSLLTSMEFKDGLSGFTDERENNSNVFFNQQQWFDILLKEKLDIVYFYPNKTDILADVGQAVYISRMRSEERTTSRREIKNFLESKLPDYMIPSEIEIMSSIPLTANGKIDKRALEARIQNKEDSTTDITMPPETKLEIEISNIWSEILNKKEINKNDNFFDIGGDSLLIAQVVAKMQKVIPEAKNMKWDALMLEILKNPTIESLAKEMEGAIDNKIVEDIDSPFTILKSDRKQKGMKILFPGGIGTLTQFNNLLPYLSTNNVNSEAIGGFRINNFEEYLKIPTSSLIKDLGVRYADILLEQKTESYKLVGYCFGGLVAIETAKNMIVEGADLNKVITIDTLPNETWLENDILMEKQFAKFIGADETTAGYDFDELLLKNMLTDIKEENGGIISTDAIYKIGQKNTYQDILRKIDLLMKIPEDKRLRKIISTIKAANGKVSMEELKEYDKLYAAFKHTSKAVWEYQQDYFMGDLTILSCIDKSSSFLPDMKKTSEEYLTDKALGNVEVKYISGNHATCIMPPYVETIANIIMEDE